MHHKIVIIHLGTFQLMIILGHIFSSILLINGNGTLYITVILLQHILNDILFPQRLLSLWSCLLQIQLVLDLLTRFRNNLRGALAFLNEFQPVEQECSDL